MLALAITGCASTDDQIAKSGNGYRCEKVKVTGSNIPKKICTTQAQRDEIERRSKEMLENRASRTAPNIGPGGN